MAFKTIKGKKVLVDTTGIPPKHLLNDDRLTKHDGRFFLVDENTSQGTLSVDEYLKKSKDLFELKKTVLFSQSQESTNDLLDTVGQGAKKTEFGYELTDEKEFIKGLDSAGGLEG